MNSPNKSATISVAEFLFFTIFSNASYPELAFKIEKKTSKIVKLHSVGCSFAVKLH